MRNLLILLLLLFSLPSAAQVTPWHGIEREIHYRPDGEDFVLMKGQRRFNRALYGGNTAFRVEAGDLPEFAMYLPGMGGNLKFGLIKGDQSKWLINARQVETRYRPGTMLYTIKDDLLGEGSINIQVLACFDRESMIVKMEQKNVPPGVRLIAVYGGATGTKFSRDGDIGADPESSFYLKWEYCKLNVYKINQNSFTLYYGSKSLSEEERYEIQYGGSKEVSISPLSTKSIVGIFPTSSKIKIVSALQQASPGELYASSDSLTPAIAADVLLGQEPLYFYLQNSSTKKQPGYTELKELYDQTETTRKQLAGRVQISTPDPYINTLGGALSMAADAIWENPSYMHGAVAWRMRLNGWRGAYVADVMGWHDRAKTHFDGYALSQVPTPLTGPVVMDTALHLARGMEKMGTSMFSSGYISRNPGGDKRPHHYDMNLVFVDQLLDHFLWTGDTNYVRQMWPLLKRHLDWEKRNFDKDGDGLYDAYAAIWASDALQYSGGGVAHTSAYNYRANLMAAQLAKLLGEDAAPFQKEADKIFKAMNEKLWLKKNGWFAEYKDLLGKKLVHPSAAVWTVYHAMESSLPDPFQAYQMLRYVDNEIPHIPVLAKGVNDSSLYLVSTTNWQPYTWSLNNVVLGETVHTALAYWQGGKNEEAYKLWKSALIESMYLGASPGNFQQISFYDAMRGELYRDFADDIGMTARSLVEGLFGIHPNLLEKKLVINPGFPKEWEQASISTPDIDYSFDRTGNVDRYQFTVRMAHDLSLSLQVKAPMDDIDHVTVNGTDVVAKFKQDAIDIPVLEINTKGGNQFSIEIKWKGNKIAKPVSSLLKYAKDESIVLNSTNMIFLKASDPQQSVRNVKLSQRQISAVVNSDNGVKTFFIKCQQGKAVYWMPVSFEAKKRFELNTLVDQAEGKSFSVAVTNNTGKSANGEFYINEKYLGKVVLDASSFSYETDVINKLLVSGTNLYQLRQGDKLYSHYYTDWSFSNSSSTRYEKLELSAYFNSEVNNIFNQKYLSPRPNSTTLQLPTQGIGNWAYALVQPVISDSGLRKRAGEKNEIVIQQNIPFRFSSTQQKNIAFVSQWDNFPDSINVTLKGKSSHVYLLMAGTTNPMQSQLANGEVIVKYQDGTSEILELKNPENWWPIEQDYYDDGYAFKTVYSHPVRVHLKTGIDTRDFSKYSSLKGFSNRAIDGGAATVLDLPLNPKKELKSMTLKAVANDVVIGLMSLTLVR